MSELQEHLGDIEKIVFHKMKHSVGTSPTDELLLDAIIQLFFIVDELVKKQEAKSA